MFREYRTILIFSCMKLHDQTVSVAGGAMLTRDTTATVVLKLPDEDGDKTLVVPPGMRILVDMIGIRELLT